MILERLKDTVTEGVRRSYARSGTNFGPPSRACVDLFFSESRTPYRIVFDNKTSFKSRHKTNTTYASQSRFFLPSLFTFTFFHTSRSALSNNAYRHHPDTTRQPYALVL